MDELDEGHLLVGREVEVLRTVLPVAPLAPHVQPVLDMEATGERDAFDLAAELAGEIDNLGDDAAAAAPAEEDFQYSVEEVFSEFKKGLAKVVKPEDVDTHYDLGIAYKEMGLLDDAITEFKLVMKDPAREVQCHLMIGLCLLEKNMQTEAIGHFKKGLYVDACP